MGMTKGCQRSQPAQEGRKGQEWKDSNLGEESANGRRGKGVKKWREGGGRKANRDTVKTQEPPRALCCAPRSLSC